MRYVQILFGVWLLAMAIAEAQWFIGACGSVLLYLGIANKGCPLIPGNACNVPSSNKNSDVKDVAFEEVRVSDK